MKYIVKGKNGIWAAWKEIKSFDDTTKAIQFCEQYKNKNRGMIGTEWYKTKVIDENNIKIYPKVFKIIDATSIK